MVRGFSIFVLSILILACSGESQAARGKRHVSDDGRFSFQLESRGQVLPIYSHRGRSYVEGAYGDYYTIRVFNHTAERIEAVVTVDGRDVITGRVGDYHQGRGYVILPYDSVVINGFRTSWQNAAAFRFTDIGDSYAARMGDASNAGVVGVAIFREESYRPEPMPSDPYPYGYYYNRQDGQGLGTGYGAKSAPAPESSAGRSRSPAAPSKRGYSGEDMASEGHHSQGLGTGYGEETYSPTTSTTFERRSRRPTAVLAVRYDDREGLHALGVLPRPYYPRPYYGTPKPEPFPSSPEPVTFAPPPPPRYYWE